MGNHERLFSAQSIGLSKFGPETQIHLKDRIAVDGATSQTSVTEARTNGIPIIDLSALTLQYLELRRDGDE
jgi:hypothetical protein